MIKNRTLISLLLCVALFGAACGSTNRLDKAAKAQNSKGDSNGLTALDANASTTTEPPTTIVAAA
ncbi:MAG: hypothetical protein H0U92_09400, partial [Actinobacteria bacterium]|nr:hypothetical protein [Actinomycetota bacterium]